MKHILQLFSVAALRFAISGTCMAQCVQLSTEPSGELFCPGDEITLVATSGFTNYTWYYNFSNSNTGGTVFANTTDNTLELDAAEWAVSYWYVQVSDPMCTEPSATVVWDSWVFAPVAISHDSNTNLCPGDSSMIASAFSGPNYFQWYKDFAPIPGAFEAEYWVTEAGYYTLQAWYPQCPNYALSSGIGPEFEMYAVIPPVIAQGAQGELIAEVSGAFTSPQWFLNGMAIDGANSATYTPEVNGEYTVQITDANGCKVMSAPFMFNTLTVGNIHLMQGKLIYPNPFQSSVQFSITDPLRQPLSIRLLDLTGKEVYYASLDYGTNLVHLGHLRKGVYLAEVLLTDGSRELARIVKSE